MVLRRSSRIAGRDAEEERALPAPTVPHPEASASRPKRQRGALLVYVAVPPRPLKRTATAAFENVNEKAPQRQDNGRRSHTSTIASSSSQLSSLRQREAELQRREKCLARSESLAALQEQTRWESIGMTERNLVQREKELEDGIRQHARAVQLSIGQSLLEDMKGLYTCPLCFDLIACPYTLNAYNCGHSFCALCLSRWFFSSLHTCGTWHESVSCPLCRAQATTPTHDSSRSRSLCPFIPNRPLDDVVKGLVEKLEGIALKVTVEDAGNETEYTESPRDPKTTLVAELVDWSEDGQKRKDWKVNEARGRTELQHIVNDWIRLSQVDMLYIRTRLLH